MFIYNYFSGTEQGNNISNAVPLQSNNQKHIPAPKLESQYRGVCQLVNGRADIEFASVSKNPQIFLNNSSNWDLVRIENRDTLSTGKFTIISNNNESNAIVDWLVIVERSLGTGRRPVETTKEEQKESKVQKPQVTNVQKDLLTELLQRVNTKTIENKPVLEDLQEKKSKKKEKTAFEKELQKKRKVIMRKISIKEVVHDEKEPEEVLNKKSNAVMNKRKVERK